MVLSATVYFGGNLHFTDSHQRGLQVHEDKLQEEKGTQPQEEKSSHSKKEGPDPKEEKALQAQKYKRPHPEEDKGPAPEND